MNRISALPLRTFELGDERIDKSSLSSASEAARAKAEQQAAREGGRKVEAAKTARVTVVEKRAAETAGSVSVSGSMSPTPTVSEGPSPVPDWQPDEEDVQVTDLEETLTTPSTGVPQKHHLPPPSLDVKGIVSVNRPWLDHYITSEHLTFWSDRQKKRDGNRNSIRASDSFNKMLHEYCKEEQAATPDKFRIPKELETYLDGSAIETFPGDSGEFDAAVVMAHAQKLQSALVFYQEGVELDTLNNFPLSDRTADTLSTWEKYKKHASRNLLNSLTRSATTYTIGVIGDSGSSGMHNCYFDTWVPTFHRLMSPLFASMNKNLTMRNAAHNGGLGAAWSLACLDSMVGVDIDALMIAFHGKTTQCGNNLVIHIATMCFVKCLCSTLLFS